MMNPARSILLQTLIVGLSVPACSDSDTLSSVGTLETCTIEPGRLEVAVGDGPVPLPFTVRAVVREGATREPEDVTGFIQWSLADETVATLDGSFVRPLSRGSTRIDGILPASESTKWDTGGDCLVAATLLVLPGPQPQARLRIEPSSLMLTVGQSLSARAMRSVAGSEIDVSEQVTWSIDDEAIAFTTGQGSVAGRAAGSARLTATLEEEDLSASALVNVRPCAIESPRFVPLTQTVRVGDEVRLRVEADVCGQVETVESPSCRPDAGSEAFFSVSTDGDACVVRGVSEGQGTLVADVAGSSPTAAITVQDFPPTGLSCSPDPIDRAAGQGYQFTCEASFSDGAVLDVTELVSCESDTPSVTEAPRAGQGVARSSGTARITCTYRQRGVEVSDTVDLTVTEAVILSGGCSINPRVVNTEIGLTEELRFGCDYTDGTSVDLTSTAQWVSGDATVAALDTSANPVVLTGGASGMTTITATDLASTESATAAVTITPPVATRLDCVPNGRVMATGSQYRQGGLLHLQRGGSPIPATSLSVAVTSTTGHCTVSGDIVRAVSPGTCSIRATDTPSGLSCTSQVTVLRRCDTPQIDGTFEGGLGLWSVSGGSWEAGRPQNVGPTAAFRGQNAVGTVMTGNMSTGQTTTLTSRIFNLCSLLPGETTIEVRWAEWYSFGNGQSFLSQGTYATGYSVVTPYTNGVAGAEDLVPEASGNNSVWTSNGRLITQFAGQTISLGFRHVAGTEGRCQFGGCGWNHRAGWYIDDVVVVAY